MPHPCPVNSPIEFLDYVKSLGLELAATAFVHYQTRPVRSGGRYDDTQTQEWCERMDFFLVSSH
jgi:hypothetical protein